MIRRDEVDVTFSERLPQALTVAGFANGGRALECRRAITNFFSGKRQVVRARFDGNVYAAFPGLMQNRHRIARREMDDVNVRVELVCQGDESFDRAVLRVRRP